MQGNIRKSVPVHWTGVMRNWSRGSLALAAICLLCGLLAAGALFRLGMPVDHVLLGLAGGAAFWCIDLIATHGWSK
jgi:hypothetical protein